MSMFPNVNEFSYQTRKHLEIFCKMVAKPFIWKIFKQIGKLCSHDFQVCRYENLCIWHIYILSFFGKKSQNWNTFKYLFSKCCHPSTGFFESIKFLSYCYHIYLEGKFFSFNFFKKSDRYHMLTIKRKISLTQFIFGKYLYMCLS